MKELSIIVALLGKEEKVLERLGYLIKSLEDRFGKIPNSMKKFILSMKIK